MRKLLRKCWPILIALCILVIFMVRDLEKGRLEDQIEETSESLTLLEAEVSDKKTTDFATVSSGGKTFHIERPAGTDDIAWARTIHDVVTGKLRSPADGGSLGYYLCETLHCAPPFDEVMLCVWCPAGATNCAEKLQGVVDAWCATHECEECK